MKKELQVHGQLLLFIMRVSLLNIALAVAFISLANANDIAAQVLDKKVTIDLDNVTLRSALTRIENTADVKFLYRLRELFADRVDYCVGKGFARGQEFLFFYLVRETPDRGGEEPLYLAGEHVVHHP